MVILACGGEGPPPGGSNAPSIHGVEPAVAQPGEQVVITGLNLIGLGTPNTHVKIGGVDATVVSANSFTIVAVVPPGAGSTVSVTTDLATDTFNNWAAGSRTTVPEIEPNDNTDGSNATPCGANRIATGTLSSTSDKDHFLFGSTDFKKFKVKVSPMVVGTVYINGAGYPLDGNGETAVFSATSVSTLVGLTGGTGSYTLTLEYQQPH